MCLLLSGIVEIIAAFKLSAIPERDTDSIAI